MYENFRFRIREGGRQVAGFSLIDAPRIPGAPITLERGVTHDAEFVNWAEAWSGPEERGVPRDLEIDVFNEEGDRLTSYKVRGCRVSSYVSMPYMDETEAVAIRLLRLDNDVWE